VSDYYDADIVAKLNALEEEEEAILKAEAKRAEM